MPIVSRSLKQSPLSFATDRIYPPCRSLAFERNKLGLSQTRLASICIVASLDIERAIAHQIARWILDNTIPLGDAATISHLEAGRDSYTMAIASSLNRIAEYLHSDISNAEELSAVREYHKLSLTRFAAVALVEASDLSQGDRIVAINQIVENKYKCSQAGDAMAISSIETGNGRKLTKNGMASFVAGFNLAYEAIGLPLTSVEELFDDYLDEAKNDRQSEND